MNQAVVTHIAANALMVALKVSMPFLVAGLIVGLLVSVFQAVTSIQEMTLSFIPKILVTGAVMIFAGPWMLNQLVAYTSALYLGIPSLIDQ
jgi:flagellar biosynthetic protein FliQ